MIRCTGSIKYKGEELIGKSSRQIAGHGILHVPEGRQVFPGLTVRENLEIGTVAWGGRVRQRIFQERARHGLHTVSASAGTPRPARMEPFWR